MIRFHVSKIEFNSMAVQAAIEKGNTRALKIVGYETRQEAAASMRSTKLISRPGSPPSSHDGTLRDFILYSAAKNSLVVGPKFIRKKSKDVASALERGGVTTNSNGKTVYIEPRPFMVPAFERVNRGMVPAVFANSVR